jgi:tetratricopeptide (TPR) repeat protein
MFLKCCAGCLESVKICLSANSLDSDRTMKTTLLILLFYLTMALPCSVSVAAQNDAVESFQQGKTYFNAGFYDDAYDKFLRAFQADPGDLDINFYLGRAAFEIGNYEMAIMAFERIIIARPDSMRVKLEMARTFLKLGLRESARQYFEEVLAANPPETVRKNIEKFLADIAVAEKRHFLNGFISVGYDWDDNVRVAPSSEIVRTVVGDVTLTGPSAKPQEDFIFGATGMLNHAYRFPDSRYSWNTTGTFFQSLYQDESDLDVVYLGLNTGPEIHSEKYLVGINGLINYLELDYDRYLRSAGLETTLALLLSQHAILNIKCKFEDKTFYQTPGRDATNVNFEIGPVFSVGANRIGASVSGEIENARDDTNSYKQYRVKTTLERILPYDFIVFGNYEFKHNSYDDVYVLFNEYRKDNIHYVGAGISKTFWRSYDNSSSLSLQLGYRYTKSDSNIDLYEYEKNVISTSVSYAF